MPIDPSLIFGNVIRDFRCALDQQVYALTRNALTKRALDERLHSPANGDGNPDTEAESAADAHFPNPKASSANSAGVWFASRFLTRTGPLNQPRT